MHGMASLVFWLTLILYCITLFTVTYVGVYLTYIAIPLIVLSGLVMKFTKPNPKTEKAYNEVKSTVHEMGKAANSFLTDANSSLKELSKSP